MLESDDPLPQFEQLLGRPKPPPLNLALKLLCLYSQTIDGLKPKQLETYARAICATYGHCEVCTLCQCLKDADSWRPPGSESQQTIES